MPGVADVLQSLVDSMSAVAKPKPGGYAFDATVQPLPGQIDVTEILEGDLGLTWITKDVRFADADPVADVESLAGEILGGLPLGGVSPPTGVGGLLGQLKGVVPLLSTTKLSVKVEVTWEVLDQDKATLPSDQYQAPNGLTGVSIPVVFKPPMVELVTNVAVPAPAMRYLRAKVKLTVPGGTKEATLPEIPVPVPPLAVPKVLVSFIHSNFQAKDGDDDGGAFILVPPNSPLRSIEQLNSTLAAVQTAVTSLKGFAGFASFLLGLSELTGALTATPYFAFAATNEVPNLNDITLIQRSWYENDTELEDELSSMIFIGPAGAQADVYCETDFNDENGRFVITVGGDGFTICRSLHDTSESRRPATEPANMIEVKKKPTHSLLDDDDLTFGDWTSGMKFI